MTFQKHCPHEWTQPAPFIPNWVRETPSPQVCPPPSPPITPNPVFPKTAITQICTPLKLEKIGPRSILMTVSIPAESIITLPSKALEINAIKKDFILTHSQFFGGTPSPLDIGHDGPKLFIGGLVRKNIQYSEAIYHTPTTVTGIAKGFVVDIPISCAIDLGRHLIFPPIHYNQNREYEFSKSISPHSEVSCQFSCSSGTEFGLLSQQFFNPVPTCQLLFSQINEIDDALDRIPLQGGPCEKYTFTTLQEKMIILLQLRLDFSSPIQDCDPQYSPDNVCSTDKSCDSKTLLERMNTLLWKLPYLRKLC